MLISILSGRVHEHAWDNALELIRPYDVVCDGTDNFPSRYLINDACVLLGKPNLWLVQSTEQAVFNREPGRPDYRDLLPEPPPPGEVLSCAEAGVMGVRPGLVGLIQATETIKVITGIGDPLDGRLLVVDGLSMRFRELRLQRDPDRPEVKNLIDYTQFCRGLLILGSASPRSRRVSGAEDR